MTDTKLFKEWLVAEKKLSENTSSSVVSRINRISLCYDIFEEISKGNESYLVSLFTYTKEEEKMGIEPKAEFVIHGDYYNGFASLKNALAQYIEFIKCQGHNITKQTIDLENKKILRKNDKILCDSLSGKFIGTKNDFLKYIGPFCRNYVCELASSYRNSFGGYCEYCHKKAVLQTAHLNGKERPTIIAEILDGFFKKSDDYYEVDIEKFVSKFKEEQTPVEEHFYILCPTCHNMYDKSKELTDEMIRAERLKK